MKKIVLRNIQVVGLHHYGRRELDLMGSYYVELEPNNVYDTNAVAVYDGSRKVGNLKRDSAKAVRDIIIENKAKSRYYLRPIEPSTVKCRRVGPQQTCAIAFKVEGADIHSVKAVAEKHSCIYVKVMEIASTRS
jgi:hypothetical protein